MAKIFAILGPRSGLMDGTENLNGNLPSLGRKPQEKSSIRKLLQACVEHELDTEYPESK